MNLSELQEKYGPQGLKYEPDPSCNKCRGSGERRTKHPKWPLYPCECVFMGAAAGEVVRKAIKQVSAGGGLTPRAADLCLICGKNPPVTGKSTCAECVDWFRTLR